MERAIPGTELPEIGNQSIAKQGDGVSMRGGIGRVWHRLPPRLDADPSRAMRGASAVAGAADYTLSPRYGNGAFGTQRKLNGRGRFVSVEPILMDFDPATSAYLHGAMKSAMVESTWRLICEMGALTAEPRTAGEIARAVGLAETNGTVTKTAKRRVTEALHAHHDAVLRSEEVRRGGRTMVYRLVPDEVAS